MKLLIGGSPCTHWSIAQTKNRETEPEGLGWELFKNYLIALEKFQPDFFLYENNKSMAPAIRAQITRELGVEPILINSALVSAQNRQRLYWTNIPGVEQPEDLGILLRDILESGLPLKEKGYTLKANYANAGAVNGVCGQHFPAPMAAEPVRIGTIESDAKNADFDSQQYRVYSPDGKSVTLCGQGGGVGAKTGLYATPICINQLASGKSRTVDAHMGKLEKNLVPRINDPNPAKQQYDCIIQPIRVGDMPNAAGEVSGRQSGRIYSVDGKGVPLQARPNGGGADGAATGLYAVPFDCDVIITENSIRCQRRDKKHSTVQGSHVNFKDGKSQTLSVAHTPKVIEPIEYNPLQSCDVVVTDQNIRCTYKDGSGTAQGYTVYFDDVKGPSVIAGHAHKMKIIEPATGKEWPVYEVRDGQITIKEKQYPIKLADGFYIIRKLTVTECKRLQTVPEDYIFPVKDAYCATTVSAAYIRAGIAKYTGTECGVEKYTLVAKKLGIWVENDAHTPKIGDACVYDWQDNGVGDCTGAGDHIGIVTKVSAGSFVVTEGNMSGGKVGKRTMAINGRYIRGFICPDFAAIAKKMGGTTTGTTPGTTGASSAAKGTAHTVVAGDTLGKIAARYGTTMDALAAINRIKNKNLIRVGQVIYLTEAAAAVAKLARLGVINSPDYWQQAAASGKVKYLDRLLVKAAGKITKAGPRSSTVANAVGALVAAGVIDTTDYWLTNYNTFPHLDALLCALGGAVK